MKLCNGLREPDGITRAAEEMRAAVQIRSATIRSWKYAVDTRTLSCSFTLKDTLAVTGSFPRTEESA